MKTAEMKFVVPKGGSVNVEEEMMPDGSSVLTITIDSSTANGGCVSTVKPNTADDTTCHQREGIFKLVPASQLSLEDDFLKYSPKTKKEQNFKNRVETAIKSGLKDFWRPVYDPSFYNYVRICYEPGKMPAVGKSYNWWAKTANEFKPEQGSRLGTKSEYVAFLAVLIKELVNSGKSVEWAWNAVCNNSKELGNYWNSKDSSKCAQNDFEPTGSREICGWYDLANSFKILAEDEEAGGLWQAGGFYGYFSHEFPLAGMGHVCSSNYRNYVDYQCCGWLVLDSCPDC